MKSRIVTVLLACAVLLLGCRSAVSAPDNLVEYAVEVTNDLLQPQGLEFGMTEEEVCKIKGFQISDLREVAANNTTFYRIITIEGLSEQVSETFAFYDGKLVRASYTAVVKKSDFEELMAQVMAQAEELLPEAMKFNDSAWVDSQGTGVGISYGSTDEDSAPEAITLDITMSKSLLNGK